MRNKQIIKELLIWALILFGTAYCYNQYSSYQETKISNREKIRHEQLTKRKTEKTKQNTYKKDGAIEIAYVKPKKLSFFSKTELLKKRKLAIVNSPLKPRFYAPNKELFNQYNESKPFFLEHGSGIYEVVVTEPIENPMILVGLNNSLQFIDKLPDYFYDNEICMPVLEFV